MGGRAEVVARSWRFFLGLAPLCLRHGEGGGGLQQGVVFTSTAEAGLSPTSLSVPGKDRDSLWMNLMLLAGKMGCLTEFLDMYIHTASHVCVGFSHETQLKGFSRHFYNT